MSIRSVPVLMFHGVAPDDPSRPPQMDHWLEPRVFEHYLAALRRDRIESLSLGELREFREGRRSIGPRAVVLTFDDGYLDFWLYVYPLLLEYETKATVFVTTDFIDPSTEPRRLGTDVPYGFLSWAEMREMEASGLVTVESHAVTHTWYPTGDDVIDAHRPDLPWSTYRHLWWNRFPERKPFWYREGRREDVPYGTPVYRHEKALLARRYLPDPAVETRVVTGVAERGGAAFFERDAWRAEYQELVADAIASSGDGGRGRVETDAERDARLTSELADSRRILTEGLGRDVRYLCCPGGSLSDEVLALAKSVGYHGVSVPAWFERGLNRPGGNLDRFYRVPTTSILRRWRSDAADAFAFRARVRSELGDPVFRPVWSGLRLLRRARLV